MVSGMDSNEQIANAVRPSLKVVDYGCGCQDTHQTTAYGDTVMSQRHHGCIARFGGRCKR